MNLWAIAILLVSITIGTIVNVSADSGEFEVGSEFPGSVDFEVDSSGKVQVLSTESILSLTSSSASTDSERKSKKCRAADGSFKEEQTDPSDCIESADIIAPNLPNSTQSFLFNDTESVGEEFGDSINSVVEVFPVNTSRDSNIHSGTSKSNLSSSSVDPKLSTLGAVSENTDIVVQRVLEDHSTLKQDVLSLADFQNATETNMSSGGHKSTAKAVGNAAMDVIKKNNFYSLKPLHAVFGAEVLDVDLSKQEFTKEFITQIKQDMVDYRVLLFRNQPTISGILSN